MDDLFEEKNVQLKEIPRTLRPRVPASPELQSEFADEMRQAKSSWYGLWYRCLRLSDEYQHCCTNDGKGRLKPIYGDFGDVVDLRFEQWWQRVGRYLFAERKAIPKVQFYTHRRDLEEITNLRDKVVIEVPLTIRKSTVVRQINKILKAAYEGRDVVPREQSTARRKLAKSKLRKETVSKMLDLYELRARKPELTLWQLGERAGIELDLMARTTDGQQMTLQQERIRMGIAVSRYLKQARNLIWNATEGVFPSIKNLSND
ncbi:hypothetical protein [Flavobacterium sp.]|jgi:hypothetical protein|uniref:hypothetical protein n=1 Tax=Flavobacterium sp. TaxID=239 RepID=UPI0037C0D0AA